MRTIINQYIENRINREKFYSDLAKIVSVDDTSRNAIINILISDLEITARCQASINLTGGVYIKPKINSYVVVNWINGNACYIALYSEIDSVKLLADTEIIFNEGENGGVPITSDIVSRLNNIEQDINDLKTAFSTWVVVPTDGGAALKASTATWYAAPLIETVDSDIENEKVKH